MAQRQKVERHVAESKKLGVPASTAAPPVFRLLWALGLDMPPPLFLGFFTLVLVMGGFFGVVWGGGMWLLQWWFWPVPTGLVIVVAAVAGLLFGLAMAGYYRWKAGKMGLASWEHYPEAEPVAAVDRGPVRRS